MAQPCWFSYLGSHGGVCIVASREIGPMPDRPSPSTDCVHQALTRPCPTPGDGHHLGPIFNEPSPGQRDFWCLHLIHIHLYGLDVCGAEMLFWDIYDTSVALLVENNRSELERFDREQRTDLLIMLKDFVNDQAKCAEKLASLWLKFAEDTSGYSKADRSILRLQQ
ncbi:hypothetical protein Dimus_009047 [Dionaea muscipula]